MLSLSSRFYRHVPKLVLGPSVVAALVFIYGFILWTIYLSFTPSTLTPKMSLSGIGAYTRLWENPRWQTAFGNLVTFTVLFLVFAMPIGIGLAILLDRFRHWERGLRPLFLYPMALSFIVTGTAWRWILNPSLGWQMVDWLGRPERAIYAVVLAAVWQSSGFVMALFLAGLRSVDKEIVHAATLDGAGPFSLYGRIILPSLAPVFFSALVVLTHTSLKTFDLVIALTGGGPGYSTDMPAVFIFAHAFERNQLALAAASAVILLLLVCSVIGPYLLKGMRRRKSELPG